MHKLSTEKLVEACKNAIELNLSNDFINLLFNELNKRFSDNSDIYYNQ
ncbi:sporulation histidine kinase inhibitor Sda [Paenibacillus sp. BSR1-1]|nr:sporulation histidine kinase inhibitor Sda [Paenibacillus sp. BSR1-1]MDN3014615.1 sporulation histidine kinase inhibitor Sda [Paenibacillus sp. BSR1-1]